MMAWHVMASGSINENHRFWKTCCHQLQGRFIPAEDWRDRTVREHIGTHVTKVNCVPTTTPQINSRRPE
jgi:hypothetical protein